MIARHLLLTLSLAISACASSAPAPPASDARAPDAPTDAATDAAPTDAPAADRAPAADAASDASAGPPVPGEMTATYRITPNVGIEDVARTTAGCAITAATGGSYRIVCGGPAGAGSIARVEGSIWVRGALSSVTPGCHERACALEAGDEVSGPVAVPGGRRVDFSWTVSSDTDGVDFVTTAEPVYFSISMDGRPNPSRVVFPSQELDGAPASASADPFGLVAQ